MEESSKNFVSRIPPVPPGLGKPSTHSRNKRRRLKKGYEKDNSTAPTPGPPKGSSLTNNLPLGQRKSKPGPSSHPPSHTNPLLSAKSHTQSLSNSLNTSPNNNHTQQDLQDREEFDAAFALCSSAVNMNLQRGGISTFPSSSMFPKHPRHENISDSCITLNQVMMGSLRNKNKKKGFKQSMANPLPAKITFTNNTTASGSQQQPSLCTPKKDTLMEEPSTSSGTTIQPPRLIPPSEIQELGQLPSNMFVTSVDVESGMWDEHLPSQKEQGSKKKQKTLNGGRCSATTDSSLKKDIITFENGQFDDAHDDSSFALPYFDMEVQTTTTNTTHAPSSSDTTLKPFDWERVERLWKDCPVLEKLEQLVVGFLVGWKVL